MTSWRETTSDTAQNDFDALVNAVLPLAEELLVKHGEFFPFGATAVAADGAIAMLAADPDLGEQPASQQVLDALYEAARADAGGLRAVAFVADVFTRAGNAVRIELEHREGAALAILAPYKRGRFSKKVSFGPMSASPGEQRIWTA